jgi:TolB protein
LYTLDIHTGQETPIASFDSVSGPRWSPVDNVIAFSGGTFEKDEMNIYLINGDGTNMRQLTKGEFYGVGSWSPDGKKLAIASVKRPPDSEIYILDIESGQLEQVTNNNTYEAYPRWIEF